MEDHSKILSQNAQSALPENGLDFECCMISIKRAAAKHMDKIVTLVEVAQCGPALPCFTSNTTKQLKQRFLQTTPEEKLIGK